jgi:dTDP-glucose 4,6-dehydratase|tara:strand:+ start:18447 stop:19397 length:951 start_codon:yes stop_codon:yes gene_type:complete
MKIIYVTGCLGFMASYFTRAALKRGWHVRGIDKFTYAANRHLLQEFYQYPNFTFEEMDIKDLKRLYDCDYVVNFAAESHVGNSIINSDDFIDSNVVGVKNLLDLVRFKPINCNDRPVFFHISTDEVYGDIIAGAHTEKDLLKPSNPYSAAKAAGDMLVHAWARTYDIRYIMLRPTNNYGIGQYPEKLIPLAVKNLLRGKPIKLHNNGTPVRNWLHAADTASAVMAIIDSGRENEIYNVAGGFEQTNKETVRKIIMAFNNSAKDWEKYVDFSAERPGQDVRYALDDSKLRELGWSPKKIFDEEIPRIVKYYKNNFIW